MTKVYSIKTGKEIGQDLADNHNKQLEFQKAKRDCFHYLLDGVYEEAMESLGLSDEQTPIEAQEYLDKFLTDMTRNTSDD